MAQASESSARHAARAASTDTPRVLVDGVDSPGQRQAELLAGLLATRATIAPKFFYDEQGSALYEAICALDEYYPPRLEAAIFDAHRHAIAATLPHGGQWVDLGCGDGRKSWPWIEALGLRRYIGVDIAEPWLRASLARAAARFKHVAFDGVVTDFTRGLALERVLAHRPELPSVFFYPGSSIGNFEPAHALALLRSVRQHLGPGDRLLIGVDGTKPEAPLVAAYDDALGVTAAFNRNVLRVANRELGADFDPAAFDHGALFDRGTGRIEMRLVARSAQQVRLGGRQRVFAPGEVIVTEHSYKYDADGFASLLHDAGFGRLHHWSDPRRWYHVFVAEPAAYRQ
jgi:dimethylhistidine N-methyltransferase